MLRLPFKSRSRLRTNDYWALADVSFAVGRGEAVGIIGRNGAGKSTLLKILSRITEPTLGRVRLRGRVSSLLEVGTGFHPELTGKENIYLNGAILGMSRAEIRARFDEIVAFAEVERFLNTPVKRYSSGMYVRLAFAVAAHLEPDILIVDEVLAVGDAEFQKKCLGKMESVARQEQRTILFVSHNLAAVRTLCDKAILLKHGRVAAQGSVESVAAAYLQEGTATVGSHSIDLPAPREYRPVWMESATVLCNGEPGATLMTGDNLGFAVKFRSVKPVRMPVLGFLIRSSRGENAINASNSFLPSAGFREPVTEGTIVCDLGALPLMAGTYSVSFQMGRDPQQGHYAEEVLYFSVDEKDVWGTGRYPEPDASCLWWDTHFRFVERAPAEVLASARVGPAEYAGELGDALKRPAPAI